MCSADFCICMKGPFFVMVMLYCEHLKKYTMKKLWLGAAVAAMFLASCAQDKEKREEFKDERDKNFMRNNLGDTAVSHSEPGTYADTAKVKTDSTAAKMR